MNMTEKERNAFIEKNAGIIGDIAKPYIKCAKDHGYTYNDLYNTGVIGMCEGIERYSIEKATKDDGIVPLEAFVRWDVRKQISNFIAKPRKHDRDENKISMEKSINCGSGKDATCNHTTLGDTIADDKCDHTTLGYSMDYERVMELLESDVLTEAERIVIRGRFIDGIKFKHLDEMIQEYLGNPKSKAFYFINTGLKKLQNALTA